MGTAKATIDLNVPPDEVWELIGGFGSLPEWMPFIRKSSTSNGGRVRQIETPDGQAIIEQLEKYDLAKRSYSYSILNAPFPVVEYLSTITVASINSGKGSHVEWSGTFIPKGVSDDEVRHLFQGIFADGLKALASRYANRE